MRLQIRKLRKGFLAARMSAFVGFVAGMRADVLLQVRELGELAMADFATVRFYAEMDASVLRQVAGVGKGLGALRALVWFGFAELQVRRGRRVIVVGRSSTVELLLVHL